MSEEIKSAGYGDGSDADSFGAYRCRHWANITHPHLRGDFIRRDAAGDTIIMSLKKYEALACDLLDARAEIIVATNELTRLSVEIVKAERAEQRIRQLERERDGWRADAEREGKNVIFHRENHDESKRRLEEAVEMLVQLRDRLSEVACDAERRLAGVDAARAAAGEEEG